MKVANQQKKSRNGTLRTAYSHLKVFGLSHDVNRIISEFKALSVLILV